MRLPLREPVVSFLELIHSMFDAEAFREVIRRVRAGDGHAAAELVREYEPLIRREVRLHLDDERLRRVFDSMDITQSVLKSFFLRTAAGEYDLDSSEQLLNLLVRMTRNKLANEAKKQYRQRRDIRRTEDGDKVFEQIATDDPTPSEELATQELLDDLRRELTFEERQLTELRADGLSWGDIAARLGGKAQARRMQLTRGIQRAAKKLGLADLFE
jgi:RNA polymerase sigma factor (sigma-70 family)